MRGNRYATARWRAGEWGRGMMATEAYGKDFWVGKILRSKDSREPWRHIVITDLGGGRAECHTLIVGEPGKMLNRGSRISLKSLATRWEHCRDDNCYCKQPTER